MTVKSTVTNKRSLRNFATLLTRFNTTHNNRYDYSKAEFEKGSVPITIVCKTHGKFYQTPNKHVSGNGCPKCARESRRLNTFTFIKISSEIHKGIYNYSKVVYTTNSTKVTIICPIHGDFVQMAATHLQGGGCIKCGGKDKLDTGKFIKKANKVHSNKYTYDKSIYLNSSTKLTVSCKIHGDFEQQPNNHLSGQGCPKCGIVTRSHNTKSNTGAFISKSIKAHGETYTYSNSVYVDSRSKVIITCRIHGNFLQSPEDHYTGKGCSKCADEQKGWGVDRYTGHMTIVYILSLPNNLFKLGITRQSSVLKRYSGETIDNMSIVYETSVDGAIAWNVEKTVLRRLRNFKYKGNKRYFKKTKNTEILTVNPTNILKEELSTQQK